jgi:hypothetical protein
LNASFGRALPMLRDGYINAQEEKDAREILWACSLTYMASSLVAVLNIWPWIGPAPVARSAKAVAETCRPRARRPTLVSGTSAGTRRFRTGVRGSPHCKSSSFLAALIRPIGKPLIRLWLRATVTT